MTQHTDEFIFEMKLKLEEEATELRKKVAEQDGNFPEYGRNDESNADEVAEFITNKAVTEAETARLEEIEAALQRISDGTYGITADGELIPEKRLRANPAATTTVS